MIIAKPHIKGSYYFLILLNTKSDIRNKAPTLLLHCKGLNNTLLLHCKGLNKEFLKKFKTFLLNLTERENRADKQIKRDAKLIRTRLIKI